LTVAVAVATIFSVIIRKASADRPVVGFQAIRHNIGSRYASTVAVAKASIAGLAFLAIIVVSKKRKPPRRVRER